MNSIDIPLSLYIHIPWCVRKCPYCDFNSHALKGNLPEPEYVAALLADLAMDYPLVAGRKLHSIFIGGGTPSLFSPESFVTLFAGIKNYFELDNIEITLEANPGTVEQARFEGFRAAGINRLSLGIQSLQDDKLKTLGRIHSASEAIKAVEIAKLAGFDNFNLDIMFGLPDQSIDDAMYDLKTALALQPTHFSWYQLTLEPNTLFHAKPPVLPMDDAIWEMQEQGQAYLQTQGFQQYEISAYAKPGKQCQHNMNYWLFGDYLGIGAGAHGKMIQGSGIQRTWKIKNPRDYLNGHTKHNFMGGIEIIQNKDLPFEFMLNALRLNQNIPLDLFTDRTGLSAEVLKQNLDLAVQKGFLSIHNNYLTKTELGTRFLNDLIVLFLDK